ncbi:MAG TPA: DUF2020 domain-containing protein [Actinomycetales bacterium]|nr:DUF2020 domain-containing protein [Actinomycetales bacterium]
MEPTVRRLVSAPVAALAGLVVLAGCGADDEAGESTMGTIRTAPPEPQEQQVPQAEPRVEADCPYLSAEEAAQLNGERVTQVRIDDQIDPPACFFSSADGTVQLTTTVYTLDSAEEATRLVDETAPPGVTDRSDVEGGWTGGRSGGPGGALVALAREEQVLAVQSTQEQSVKAQRVAELVAPRIAD